MKVLIAHNDYGKYSGEERVVDNMIALFKDLGYDVVTLRPTSAEARESLLGQVRGFFSGIYSRKGVKAMREILRKERPDVVNIHNLYPFISPAALKECRKAGAPVVMTVHNFRLICPTGLFLRQGSICEECLTKGNEWGCIRHNCEASLPKSIGYALRNYWARVRGFYKKYVDIFACINHFQKEKLIQAGFAPEKITVIPNVMTSSVDRGPSPKGDYVAYCGRISQEKGIDLILEAARRHPEIPFKLAGECRDSKLIENLPSNVTLCGYLSGKDLEDFYRHSRFNVMASRCYEGFPTSILEAARFGKPTIGPNHGGFPEIIGEGENAIGLLFSPGNLADLEDKLQFLWHAYENNVGVLGGIKSELEKRYNKKDISYQWKSLITDLTQKG